MRVLYCVLCCFSLSVGTSAVSAAPGRSPSDGEIHQILVKRIDTEKRDLGIVVGVLDRSGRRIISYGSLEKGDPRPLNGDTVFEIGSITKVFTALLLTDMAQRGELELDDSVAKYLPATVKVPERDGRVITLADLATHTSGLPRMPTNFRPKDPANPYADYTEQRLFEFLTSYELIRDPGVRFEYSNLGFGLLGVALARRAGMSYESMVEKRICEPLGMTSTRITMSPDMERRFAAAHSSDLITVSRWDIPGLAGAGALRSTANDMLTFLSAIMGYTRTPLAPAMKALLSVTRPTGQPFLDSALGWVVDTRGGGEIIWKNGGTGGFRTFIGYVPKSGVGIVALSNTSTDEGVDDIGLHLLDARYPLTVPEGSPVQVPVDPKQLDKYVGCYEMQPNFILSVTRQGDQLYVRATGQARFAVYPKGNREFFYKVVDAQISFEVGADGSASGLVLHQNGRDQHAKRIDEAQAQSLEEAVAQRFKDQTAMPGSDLATRRLIEQMQSHRVDYEQFTPEFAVVAHQAATESEASVIGLGSLRSVTFKGVGAGGMDVYEIRFDKGAIDWRILLANDGKIAAVGFRKIP